MTINGEGKPPLGFEGSSWANIRLCVATAECWLSGHDAHTPGLHQDAMQATSRVRRSLSCPRSFDWKYTTTFPSRMPASLYILMLAVGASPSPTGSAIGRTARGLKYSPHAPPSTMRSRLYCTPKMHFIPVLTFRLDRSATWGCHSLGQSRRAARSPPRISAASPT